MPKVSVIVPNYNHAPYLQQRIESILTQTYQDFELILLDDCSTDDSKEVLIQYQNNSKVSHVVFNETNSGSTFKQWNRGITLAKGEYIWIAESDDWADERFLEIIMAEIYGNEEIGLAYTASKLINSTGNITFENKENNTGEIIKYSGNEFIKQKLLHSNSIWNASMLVFKKDLFINISDNSYMDMRYCGDWFLYLQMSLHTSVLEIKKTLNNYRIHNQNVSNRAKQEGLYFTEGFSVFIYATRNIEIQKVSKILNLWAKMYVKSEQQYCFSKEKREQIKKQFYKYSSLLRFYVGYWNVKYKLKRLLK